MKFLVTGAAGFIGMHTCSRLLEEGHQVVGLDNLNSYYDVNLKRYRLEKLTQSPSFKFIEQDLSNRDAITEIFLIEQFQRVIHLGAQAGVRYSINNPMAYVDSNLVGTMTVLEGCRHNNVEHLVYASSSSVYGMNSKVPFSTDDSVDHPASLYAATKKSNELMAHSYSHLYNLPTTGLRFFTVYGPAGRPDMAPWLFTESIIKGNPIKIYNHGSMQRDFTYIDDIVEGIVRIQDIVPRKPDKQSSHDLSPSAVPYRVYNIGNSKPVKLLDFVESIERACGKAARKIYLDMQPGDVKITFADVGPLVEVTGFKPAVDVVDGVQRFVDWYRGYIGL
jgi:UDP-glucuronate 4-epimerase